MQEILSYHHLLQSEKLFAYFINYTSKEKGNLFYCDYTVVLSVCKEHERKAPERAVTDEGRAQNLIPMFFYQVLGIPPFSCSAA